MYVKFEMNGFSPCALSGFSRIMEALPSIGQKIYIDDQIYVVENIFWREGEDKIKLEPICYVSCLEYDV